ncbi:hypothetical protein [uncultured Ilumatobacter sp.]|jgi:hypothetical protein|uniref:hypothetical protein n=1 Tax=uncultured Ilumatobacter sp. TaxID=879968 RepID=UPI00374E2DDB|tara:strand:- start:1764 stop:2147 length:384 start_codon:yes stop_codon:yes gene_type:complete
MTNRLKSGGACGCAYRVNTPAHHDRLITLEQDPLAVLGELVDLAATWGEVEDPAIAVIDPADWIGFVEQHEWKNPERVLEIVLGLWSTTRPCRHDVQSNVEFTAPLDLGTVTAIGAAPSAPSDMQTA